MAPQNDGTGFDGLGPRVPSRCPVYLKKKGVNSPKVERPIPPRDGRGGGRNGGRGRNRRVV